MPRQPIAPFQLTVQQQAELDLALTDWENGTAKVDTFMCDLERWEYDPVWADPRVQNKAITFSSGKIKYKAPDMAVFEIDKIQRIDPATGKYNVAKNEQGEHWVCTGKSVWEIDAEKKLVTERVLPPHMQGKAIASGPLPFVFGAKADELKARYFMRVITPQKFAATEVHLEAWPRRRDDAANYSKCIFMLQRKTHMPTALRVYDPNGKSYTTYGFRNSKVNPFFPNLFGVFGPPKVPKGFTKIVENPPAAPVRAAQVPQNRPRQRPPAGQGFPPERKNFQ